MTPQHIVMCVGNEMHVHVRSRVCSVCARARHAACYVRCGANAV